MKSNNMKLFYRNPDIYVEDMWTERMLCDSLVGGGLEDTFDDPIYDDLVN